MWNPKIPTPKSDKSGKSFIKLIKSFLPLTTCSMRKGQMEQAVETMELGSADACGVAREVYEPAPKQIIFYDEQVQHFDDIVEMYAVKWNNVQQSSEAVLRVHHTDPALLFKVL